MSAVVCESDGGILLAKRAAEGLFGGLWEPPMVEAVAPRAARKAFSGLGLELAGVRLREVGHVRHVLSHFELDVRVLRLAAPGIASTVAPVDGWSQYTTWKYVPKTLGGVAVSTLARKVLSAARLAP